ncbi:hypothetical protein [Crystallibacter crystallopoietes]|nr:hypothetical protein [Arthrobacter crystallopoietes]
MKFGSAFFGWMTATGVFLLLSAVATALAALFGATGTFDPGQLAEQARQNLQTVSIVGAITLAVVLFIAYYCGGYVAGRMARFDGAKQGLAVWLWAVVISVLVAILAAVTGLQSTAPAGLDSLPRVPVDEGSMTAGGIILLVAVALITLAAAVVGGQAGMRYHRKVDRVEANPDVPAAE